MSISGVAPDEGRDLVTNFQEALSADNHEKQSNFGAGLSSMSKDSKKTKIESWHAYMNYKFIFNLNYSYRAKTEAVF